MIYTINRIDNGKPMEHYAPGQPHDRQPKAWHEQVDAQREADANNINSRTWEVVPHAAMRFTTKEAV